jgi:SAM-dependent methyltransferase
MAKSELPSIYATPLLYEAFFSPGLVDLPFYEAWARACAGPVLELGCGTGRLLWALRKTGLSVEGLDASAEMLEACHAEGKRLGLEAALHRGDWRSFDLGKRFAGIALPFNGLQHLHNAEDLNAFFERLRAHLLPGGSFALDLHLPQAALLARDPNMSYCLRFSSSERTE